MPNVNPEPAGKGKYDPVGRVTAVYGTCDNLRSIIQSLNEAGFTDKEIDVFIGDEGADKLDLKKNQVGAIVRFLRELEMSLSDESEIHKLIDENLRSGGMVLNVLAGNDDQKKARAAQILKAHNAHDVRYWGRWSIERF